MPSVKMANIPYNELSRKYNGANNATAIKLGK